ncbi:ABC transporter ATP-binding protein [Capnocytophaga canimorsus]|uniref:ABC transporter ATP-binding protein n=1 Tax=Capnocytophaga canimorsus TaxID=28188 RepID=UPI0037D8F2FA
MLQVNNISYTYGDTDSGFRSISFQLQQGEHLSIMGESGSGKSTLLKAIYGLLDVQQGTISFNERNVLGPSQQLVPGDSQMKYLAQDFGLMPYHTVAENVGKFLSNIDLEYKKQRIDALLSLVDMSDFAQKKALLLSGGEKQRIGLVVALAKEPRLLLLDEPFSQVDQFKKNHLQRNLFAYLKKRQISCIVATHDSREALAFSDKVLILKGGKMVNEGVTSQIFNQQTDFYTASLFGEVSRFPLPNGEFRLLKPHQIQMVAFSHCLAEIENSYFQGDRYLIETRALSGRIYFFSEKWLENGQKIYLSERK